MGQSIAGNILPGELTLGLQVGNLLTRCVMFFQGADSTELLAASGKDPVARWKTAGKVRREYDKASKTFLVIMEGTASATKLSLPKDTKSLGLSMRYLILQVLVPAGKAVSVELGVTDANNNRRRLLLSSAFRESAVHQLHAQIPFQNVRRDAWINLTFDVGTLVNEAFSQVNFKSIDSIVLSGVWKIRRIFAMKDAPVSALAAFTPLDDNVHYVDIPRTYVVPGCPVEYFAMPPNSWSKATAISLTAKSLHAKAQRPESAPVATSKKQQTKRPSSSSSKTSEKIAKGKPGDSRLATSSGKNQQLQAQQKRSIRPIDATSQLKTIFSFASPSTTNTTTISPSVQESIQHIIDKKSIFNFDSLNIPPLPGKSINKPTSLCNSRAKTSKFVSWEDDDDDNSLLTVPLSERMETGQNLKQDVVDDSSESSPASIDSISQVNVPLITCSQSTFSPNQEDELPSNTQELNMTCEEELKPTVPVPTTLIRNQSNQQLCEVGIAIDQLANKMANIANSENVACDKDDLNSECSFDMTEELKVDGDGETSFDFDDELEESLPAMVHKDVTPEELSPKKASSPKLSAPKTFNLAADTMASLRLQEEPNSSLDSTLLTMDPRLKSLLDSMDWSQPVAAANSNESVMDLVYDPILQCYHDVATNKYYQLKK